MMRVRVIRLRIYQPASPESELAFRGEGTTLPVLLQEMGLRLAHEWELPVHLGARAVVTCQDYHLAEKPFNPLQKLAVVSVSP